MDLSAVKTDKEHVHVCLLKAPPMQLTAMKTNKAGVHVYLLKVRFLCGAGSSLL